MKRCLSCGEIVLVEDEFCRQCGSSYLVSYDDRIEGKTETGIQESDSGNNSESISVLDYYSFSQFGVGFLIVFVVQLIVFFLVYFSNEIEKSMPFGGEWLISGVLYTLPLLIAWIGVIGWKGNSSKLYFIAVLLISYIPIIGALLVALFVGRGVFELLERRKLQQKSVLER